MDVRRKEKIEAPSSMPAPGSIAKTASVRFGYLVSSLCVLAALAPPANAQSDCVYDLRGETNVSGHAPYRLKLSQQGSAISGSAEILAPDGTSVVNRGEVTGQAGFENFWLEFRWERGDPYNPVRLQGARRKDDRYVAEIVYSYTGEYFRIGLARPSVCMNYRLYKPMLDVDARVPGQFGLLLRAQAEGPVRGLLQLYRQGEVIWSRNTDPSTAYNVPIGSPAGEEYHACFQSGLQTQCTEKLRPIDTANAVVRQRAQARETPPVAGSPRPGGRFADRAEGPASAARPMAMSMSRVLRSAPAATGDTCASGFVWREAAPADHVCVPPQARTRSRSENLVAASRVDPRGAYGPATCISGFVWRGAFAGDTVCVAPSVRDLVAEENRLGPSRRAR